jgi:hypothetical protein
MRFYIAKGNTENRTVTDETINALAFRFATDKAAMTATDLDLIRVKIYRTQDGRRVQNLVPDSITLHQLLRIISGNDYPRALAALTQRQVDGDFAGGYYMLVVPIGVQNFKNSVGLFIQVENGGLSDATKTCQMEVETIATIGVEGYIPQVDQMTLDSNIAEYDLQLGDFVTDVVSEDTANFERCEIQSDKLNVEYGTLAFRAQVMARPNIEAATTPTGPLKYVDAGNSFLNKVRIKLAFSAAAARTIYIIRKVRTRSIVANVVAKTAEHQNENMSFIKAVPATLSKLDV